MTVTLVETDGEWAAAVVRGQRRRMAGPLARWMRYQRGMDGRSREILAARVLAVIREAEELRREILGALVTEYL